MTDFLFLVLWLLYVPVALSAWLIRRATARRCSSCCSRWRMEQIDELDSGSWFCSRCKQIQPIARGECAVKHRILFALFTVLLCCGLAAACPIGAGVATVGCYPAPVQQAPQYFPAPVQLAAPPVYAPPVYAPPVQLAAPLPPVCDVPQLAPSYAPSFAPSYGYGLSYGRSFGLGGSYSYGGAAVFSQQFVRQRVFVRQQVVRERVFVERRPAGRLGGRAVHRRR